MATAADIMTSHVKCVGEQQTLAEAARMMRDLDVGALPICGDDDRLHGIITDRDIALKCVRRPDGRARRIRHPRLRRHRRSGPTPRKQEKEKNHG